MKRIVMLFVAFSCILAMAACTAARADSPYFTGKVIEKYENRCLVEVTDTGNGNFFVGEILSVNTDIKNRPDYEIGDYLTVVFDGKVALSYPAQVLSVYEIRKTDAGGNDLP